MLEIEHEFQSEVDLEKYSDFEVIYCVSPGKLSAL